MKPTNPPSLQTPSTGDRTPAVAVNGSVLHAVQADTASAKVSSAPLPISEAEFQVKNQRRLDLIERHFEEGLSTGEAAELAQLQEEVGAYLDARFSSPKEFLDRLEEQARHLGFVP